MGAGRRSTSAPTPASRSRSSISYVTDPFTGGAGLMVDDTALVVDGAATRGRRASRPVSAHGRCSAPRRAAPATPIDFDRTDGLGGIHAVISTADTLLFGFGLEQLESDADRAAVVGAILDYLG